VEGYYCHVFVKDWRREQRIQERATAAAFKAAASTQLLPSSMSDPAGIIDFDDWLDYEEDIPGRIVKEEKSLLTKGMEFMLNAAAKAKEATGEVVKAANDRRKTMKKKKKKKKDDDSSDDEDEDSEDSGELEDLQEEAPEEEKGDFGGAEGDGENGGVDDGDDSSHYSWEDEQQLYGDELNCPKWVKKGGFMRCGCRYGVPQKSRQYNPVPVSAVQPLRPNYGHVDHHHHYHC